MLKEGKFGSYEAISLIVIIIVSKIFFTGPGVFVRAVGTAGWYANLLSAAAAILGFTFIYLLLKRFPNKNIVEIFNTVFGNVIGTVLIFAIIVLIMINISLGLREFTEVLKVYVFPISPPTYIICIFMLGTIVLAYAGLEPIVRFARLQAYYLLFGFIAVLLLSWQNFDLQRLFPFYGHGISSTLYHGITSSSAYGEVIILAAVAGSLQGVKQIKKIGYTSIAISGLLISIGLMAFILVFPYNTAVEITSPMYQMTRLIDYGKFFQRLDPIFLFVWIISTLISITAMLYISISLYCKTFDIEDSKPLVLPFVITLVTITMIPKDEPTIALSLLRISREYGWTIFYLLPLIALIIAKIRRKGTVKNA